MLKTLFLYFQKIKKNKIFFYSLKSPNHLRSIVYLSMDGDVRNVEKTIRRRLGDSTVYISEQKHMPFTKFLYSLLSEEMITPSPREN